jgi:hypothetical protein
MSLYFTVLHSRSTNTLSNARPAKCHHLPIG